QLALQRRLQCVLRYAAIRLGDLAAGHTARRQSRSARDQPRSSAHGERPAALRYLRAAGDGRRDRRAARAGRNTSAAGPAGSRRALLLVRDRGLVRGVWVRISRALLDAPPADYLRADHLRHEPPVDAKLIDWLRCPDCRSRLVGPAA